MPARFAARALLAATLAGAAALAGAHDAHEAAAPADAPGAAPAPTGFVAVLEDEVRPLPRQRIHWDTYWKLCWQPVDAARGYELQVITSEGTSRKLRYTDTPCMRIQVATNENRRSEGFRDRDLQLALQAGQLALRVRARLADGAATDWSDRHAVGRETVAAAPVAGPASRAAAAPPQRPHAHH